MNDENHGDKKEQKTRRRFPRRRRSGGEAGGRDAARSPERANREGGENPSGQASAPSSKPRPSRPPRRNNRAQENASDTQQGDRENSGGSGGSGRARGRRRRPDRRRGEDGRQQEGRPNRGESGAGDRRSRAPKPGSGDSGSGRDENRGSRQGSGRGSRSSDRAGRPQLQSQDGRRGDASGRSSGRINRGGTATSADRSAATTRDTRRGSFRDTVPKRDSFLPEPFLREEAYSEALAKETGGYEEMTNEQLTYLKTVVIEEDDFDVVDEDVKVPDNAVLMDIAGIKLHHADPVLMFDSKDIHLEKGDRVVVETKKGLALGDVLVGTRRQYVKQHNLPRVIRKMSPGDNRQRERNSEKEATAYTLCKERIDRLRLPMKLIEVEYLHGGNKAVFYFSAEGRVDFRELVRDLAQRLHTRIEMRQIGVRDVSRIVGGVGICGCRLCCNLYLREFKPISIRMAKDQNLVLNPQKVSGVCGRLLCCLTYENEVYQKAAQTMPRVGRRVITPDGEGRIRDRDVLKRIIRVQLNEESQLREYHVDQVEFVGGRGNEQHREKPQNENDSDHTAADESLDQEIDSLDSNELSEAIPERAGDPAPTGEPSES